jgi:Flp pilus assembly protein TadG
MVLPVFMLLLMGIMDLGRAVWYYNAISNGAAEGARYAIIQNGPGRDVAGIRQHVKDKTAGVPLADGDIVVTGSMTPTNPITVRITYRFTPITPLIGAIAGNLDLSAAQTMTVEY